MRAQTDGTLIHIEPTDERQGTGRQRHGMDEDATEHANDFVAASW